jgi:hypothetical protein
VVAEQLQRPKCLATLARTAATRTTATMMTAVMMSGPVRSFLDLWEDPGPVDLGLGVAASRRCPPYLGSHRHDSGTSPPDGEIGSRGAREVRAHHRCASRPSQPPGRCHQCFGLVRTLLGVTGRPGRGRWVRSWEERAAHARVPDVSRDVIVQDIPVGISTENQIPDDWQPQPLPFGHAQVIHAVRELAPEADTTDPEGIHVILPGVDVAVNVTDKSPLESFALHVRATDRGAADAFIGRLLDRLGARAFDAECTSGIFES